MIGTISQIDQDQLRLLLQRGWIRRINSVHIHHTWRPNHAQWQGRSTVEAIRRYHVDEMHWSDIAEHLTIGPDGSIWTGRDLDRPPASISGHNGTPSEGPFMIEMIGDFDVGQDTFRDPQADVVYQTVADICTRFKLDPDAIRFHNEFTNAKTCPGTSLKLGDFRAAVRAKLRGARRIDITNADARAYAAQVSVADSAGRALESGDVEPHYDASQAARSWSVDAESRGFGAQCSSEETEVFRSHVIDLARGQLSDSGCYQNDEADLDELIKRLDHWATNQVAAAAPVRVMFYAHGGLVDEQGGLGGALRDYHWWLANGVYPIFFVWETGFLEVFAQASRDFQAEVGARALSSDDVLEFTLGPTVGRPAWDRIKDSAFLSSSGVTGTGRAGGAALFARKFAAWVAGLAGGVAPELHAVGHSAGSIFHCHFLPALEVALQDAGITSKPTVKTLAFLAPAVRTDLFTQMLLPLVGAAQPIETMTMFTMTRHAEKADDVIKIYRKSLLYFVSHACERPTHTTPILGLEESVRDDAALTAFFGLGTPGKAEVVWSPTAGATGNAASQAIHHGAFDNDSPTLNSVMRRILRITDAQALPCTHLPIKDVRACAGGRDLTPAFGVVTRSARREATVQGGAMSALCIGIDSYGAQSLTGCVADSQSFVETLGQWGFTVQHLTNERATRQGITSAIDALLSKSSAGDIVVIQYAGHGTQLADLSGDESDGYDEAWVPYDYTEGEFVIDDDLGALFDRHRDRGIELVIFTDCCHSGTSTRFMPSPGAPQNATHSRYLEVPRDVVDRFRAKRGMAQTGARFGAKNSLGWEIHFAACQDRQSAYERGGHGDFTQAMTSALLAARRTNKSYADLAAAIAQTFSGNSLQTPMLRALQGVGTNLLFAAPRGPTTSQGGAADASDLGGRIDQLAAAINVLSKKIDDL